MAARNYTTKLWLAIMLLVLSASGQKVCGIDRDTTTCPEVSGRTFWDNKYRRLIK